ncbi:MAG TPA: hypothetical protein PK339_12105 [Flavitalea sp.]|nr:hypothetical protein [Flavitalea sp.]
MITEESENRRAPSKKLRSVKPYDFQEENEKLIRENKELERTIEKLEFFNGLLEKEIRELKGEGDHQEQGPGSPAPLPFYYRPKKKVSKQAFNLVLALAIFLGAFALYSIFIVKADYPFLRRIQGKPPVELLSPAPNGNNTRDAALPASPARDRQSSNALPPTGKVELQASPGAVQASGETAIKENKRSSEASLAPLPNQAQGGSVASQDAGSPSASPQQQKNASATPAERNTETTVAAVNTLPASSGGASVPNAASSNSPASKNEGSFSIKGDVASVSNAPTPSSPAVQQPAASETSPATGNNNKKQLGVYKVASKANFYNKPDPSALNGTFIYQFSPAELHALDETKDFIYVNATNNLGNTINGWLSKQDLRRIDK